MDKKRGNMFIVEEMKVGNPDLGIQESQKVLIKVLLEEIGFPFEEALGVAEEMIQNEPPLVNLPTWDKTTLEELKAWEASGLITVLLGIRVEISKRFDIERKKKMAKRNAKIKAWLEGTDIE